MEIQESLISSRRSSGAGAIRRIRLILAVAALALVVAAAPVTPAAAASGGANNVVLATASDDGDAVVRSATQVTSIAGDTVTSMNVASATARGCDACHATAVAVQVVFVTGTPSYFAPANLAAAVNTNCTSCGSFAYAWQYVVQAPKAFRLSPQGHRHVSRLRHEISASAGSILPTDLEADEALRAELDALTSELKELVDAELQTSGDQPVAGAERQVRAARAA